MYYDTVKKDYITMDLDGERTTLTGFIKTAIQTLGTITLSLVVKEGMKFLNHMGVGMRRVDFVESKVCYSSREPP